MRLLFYFQFTLFESDVLTMIIYRKIHQRNVPLPYINGALSHQELPPQTWRAGGLETQGRHVQMVRLPKLQKGEILTIMFNRRRNNRYQSISAGNVRNTGKTPLITLIMMRIANATKSSRCHASCTRAMSRTER